MGEANRELGRGCLSIAARIVVIRLAAVGIVFAIGAISVFFGLVVGMLTEAVWGIVAAATVFFLIAFGGGYLFLIGAVLVRKSRLDRAFQPLGFTGRLYRLMFRRYEGTMAGRRAEAFFYRGPNLEIILSSNLKTRAGITLDYADTSAAADLLGSKPVQHGVPGMEDVRVWSEDEVWVRQALMDPRVQEDLRTLLSERAFFVRSIVKVFPGHVQLHLSGNRNVIKWEITPDMAGRWVTSLSRLAEHLETRVPKAGRIVELSPAEDLALQIKRKDTTRITIYFVIGLLGFFLLVSVFTALLVAVVANM